MFAKKYITIHAKTICYKVRLQLNNNLSQNIVKAVSITE